METGWKAPTLGGKLREQNRATATPITPQAEAIEVGGRQGILLLTSTLAAKKKKSADRWMISHHYDVLSLPPKGILIHFAAQIYHNQAIPN